MSHPSITIHQTSSRVGNVTRFVRINRDGIGLRHCLDILNRLGIQVPLRFRLGARLFLDAVTSVRVDHGSKVTTPNSVGMDEKRQAVFLLKRLAQTEDLGQSVNGAFFSRTNDGYDCEDGCS